MKKFKSPIEKKALHDRELEVLLSEKHFLRNVFLNYIHLPVCLLSCLLMVGSVALAGLPLLSAETALLAYLAAAVPAFFYAFHTWSRWQSHKQVLRNARNSYLGNRIYPTLFALISLYLALPLGLLPLSLTLIALVLSWVYSRPGATKPLGTQPFFQAQTITLVLALLTLVPLVIGETRPPVYAWAFPVVVTMILGGVNTLKPKWMALGL